MEIGGGWGQHRLRLDEMVMIKDNHIAVGDSIESLIKRKKETQNLKSKWKIFQMQFLLQKKMQQSSC